MRLRHDVAFVYVSIFMEPLLELLDETEAGELRAFYYETLMAALEAFERELDRERMRLHPVPSEN